MTKKPVVPVGKTETKKTPHPSAVSTAKTILARKNLNDKTMKDLDI